MDQQVDLVLPEPENKKIPITKKSLLVVSLSALFVVSFAFSGLMLYKYNSLSKKFEMINNQSSAYQQQIDEVKSKLPKDDFSKISSRLDQVDNRLYFMSMEHRAEGGIVTDDFVIEKLNILALPSLKEGTKGLLMVTIDLDTQPTAYSKYKGQGKFNVPDRELKSMIGDIVNKVSKEYTGSDEFIKGIPKWEEGSIAVTIKNYEIGKYENGVFKLKGE